MNKQEKFDEDILRHYINPEMIEKAPDGFASKTMTRIQLETESSKITGRFRIKSIVPVVSIIITAALISAAILVPVNGTDSIGLTALKYIESLGFSLPKINLTPIFEINIPRSLTYVFISILILTLFDRALFGFFHRERK